MTTDEALAQMDPRIPRLQTILASLCAWCDIAYLVEMCAGCHGAILLLYKMIVYSHRDNTSNANTLTIHSREGLCHWLNGLKPSCSFLQVAELPIRTDEEAMVLLSMVVLLSIPPLPFRARGKTGRARWPGDPNGL